MHDAHEGRIFGIGLSRTGTTSLAKALNLLKIRTIHYPHDRVTHCELERRIDRLTVLEEYDAITDITVAPFYRQLDDAYPGSKFILTIRDKPLWLRSMKDHLQRVTDCDDFDEQFRRFTAFISTIVYGTTYFDENQLSDSYDQHVHNVLEYFQDRQQDLLVLDICAGEGWDKLCPFLACPIPTSAFPHANVGNAKAVRDQPIGLAQEELTSVIPSESTFTFVPQQSMTAYPPSFYDDLKTGVRQSAEVVVPIVMQLLRPRRVIDVGCGLGTWLSVFAEHGVNQIVGVDGSYVERESLEIPDDCFLPLDLTQPLKLDQRFDLVVSLEVAEHLPPDCAADFVNSLTGLGPVVLFSAAVPFQEGRHHVNEQWPHYWAQLFQRDGFVAVDCLRSKIWIEEGVQWWYRQNLLLFVDRRHLESDEGLADIAVTHTRHPLSLIHPDRYLEVIGNYQSSQSDLWRLKSELIVRDLEEVIPRGDKFILVDQNLVDHDLTTGYQVFPFLEKEGAYWGAPPNDRAGITEVARLRRSGAGFMVFAWPAFWWLEHYTELANHLRLNFNCVIENGRMIVFDLRDSVADGSPKET